MLTIPHSKSDAIFKRKACKTQTPLVVALDEPKVGMTDIIIYEDILSEFYLHNVLQKTQ